MKNTLVIRKDIKMPINRLIRVSALTGAMLSENISELEVLETLNMKELYDLEEKCIEKGAKFSWIEDGKTVCGIVIYKQETIQGLTSSFKQFTPEVVTNNLGIK